MGKYFSIWVCSALISSIILMCFIPNVSAYPEIDRSCAYTFYDATGGDDSDWTLFSDGRYSVGEKRVEGYSTCIGVGYGATGWAKVWKTVECTASGEYYTNMGGNYWAVMSAAGGAVASVLFELRIYDLGEGGNPIASSTIFEETIAIGYAVNIQNYFYTSLVWYGYSGHLYGLTLYVKAWTAGVLGTAIADAAGDGSYFAGTQGAYYNYVQVGTYSSVGGGCVHEDTEISTPDGSVETVKTIKKGDGIVAYDLINNTMLNETVLKKEKTKVQMIQVINSGLLMVTPMDQPIYARNETYTGWIKNPYNLTIGWEIFNAIDQTWIEITEVRFIWGQFMTYDITTSGPNNYIANGILVDAKIPF